MSDWKTSNQQYGSQHGRSGSGPKNKTKIGRSTLEYLESLDKGNFVHEQEKIAQRERHGLFTQPLGLSPGDLYQDLKRTQLFYFSLSAIEGGLGESTYATESWSITVREDGFHKHR